MYSIIGSNGLRTISTWISRIPLHMFTHHKTQSNLNDYDENRKARRPGLIGTCMMGGSFLMSHEGGGG
jgi:hypothetical protein